jgi:hypothetical protein
MHVTPFGTGCLPLNYSCNPVVTDVSYRGCCAEDAGTADVTSTGSLKGIADPDHIT